MRANPLMLLNPLFASLDYPLEIFRRPADSSRELVAVQRDRHSRALILAWVHSQIRARDRPALLSRLPSAAAPGWYLWCPRATGADVVAVACPFCTTVMEDGINARKGDRDVRVMDVSELLQATQPLATAKTAAP